MSLKPLLIIPILLLAGQSLFGRSGQVAARIEGLRAKGVRFEPVVLLQREAASAATDARWSGDLKKATLLNFVPDIGLALSLRGPGFISVELPGDDGTMILDLERVQVTTDDFKISTASGVGPAGAPGVHYRGMIRGVPGSLAAISVFADEVMGLINDTRSEFVLGRLQDRKDAWHVFYNVRDMRRANPFNCDTREDGEPYHHDQLIVSANDRTVRCVRYYWEVNYPIFQDKGSIINTINYVTGLFNQSAILFDNDGIDVTLSEVFVWDVPSPYVQTATGELLTQFGVTRTSFNGDMAHLLGYAGGGGIAWLNTLCSSQTRLRMAYSDINSNYSNVPTYSWSVEVVTHEQGHNLGSKHTHACAWNGDATAIDGCGPTANVIYAEGSCPTGPVPTSAVGGTIMSYCHLVGAGINFNNGFGPQPSAVIVNAVNAATCLTTCGTSCDPPGYLTAFSITTNSAILSWSTVGATGYTLRWRPAAGGTWTTVTGLAGNTYALTGLTQTTAYEFQVLSICGASSSAYSGSVIFSTIAPCPDALEPNNSLVTAATLALPATVSALIAVNGDLDYYRFTLPATSNVFISLSNVAGDYDLHLLDNTGAQLATSTAGGTANESISFNNAAAGTYYVHVFGFNGAFSSTLCYALNVNAYVLQTCPTPQNVVVTDISFNAATVSWSPVQFAVGYDLRWKEAISSTWNDVTGLSLITYVISGLNPATLYDVQVRSRCEGSIVSTSAYSNTVQFTTLAAPCELTPPVRVAVKVVLDGAYRAAQQLMVDSLRDNGVLPLQEPYTAAGYVLSGSGLTTAPVLGTQGANAITDWVVVELRNATTPATIVEARAALLQRDGDVVGLDGQSVLGFCAAAGSYYVAVHHRNHLGVMTAAPVTLAAASSTVDFTLATTATYGTNAQRTTAGPRRLWAGNCVSDRDIKYTGEVNDRDAVLFSIGGTIPTNSVSGYRLEDCNLDGVVKYTGTDNDRDVILETIGGAVPTNTVSEQLP